MQNFIFNLLMDVNSVQKLMISLHKHFQEVEKTRKLNQLLQQKTSSLRQISETQSAEFVWFYDPEDDFKGGELFSKAAKPYKKA